MNSLRQFTRRKALQSLAVPPSQGFSTIRLWQRHFNSTPAVASRLAGIDPSKLTVTKTSSPKELTPAKDLVFGKTFTGMCNPQI
ncbi:unnamed protein product [Aspergillus oryzae]|uniref:Unnamed protein product n=2 Tax=Aspergillus oryzae TaxID=5062 RepID=A0AAN5C146_ASPOZ|nr:unnamed protein product [Aspergillus oryzae]GMF96718.1 unnamed protein product [Aspergillus oryzae]GMG14648.1 unnamed protein product [Aspergillus oryzae]GMG35268.1 unnamed protein product [Aspergillus oryzae]GMG54382.1 unnamed protein product [Aspergillus oryzae var. brunneus]